MNHLKKGIIVCSILGALLSAGVSSYAKDVLLKEGMQNEDVKQVQISLKQLGYFDNDTTGYFGKTTKEAVEKFQSDRKFSVDGVVGPATWSSLVGNIKPVSDTEEVNKAEIDLPEAAKLGDSLKKGMQNEQIKMLQKRLKDLRIFNNDITGYYGDATVAAVENFQKKNEMSVDGVVGNGTWSKLFKVTEDKKEIRVAVSRGSEYSESAVNSDMIDFAKSLLGVKYVWGGNTPSGFDCSGYVKYVYQKFGIELERVAADQANGGTVVAKPSLKPGDLVFFDTDGGHNYINHVGIYIGNGMFIQESSGSGKVVISSLNEGFYERSYMAARRYIN